MLRFTVMNIEQLKVLLTVFVKLTSLQRQCGVGISIHGHLSFGVIYCGQRSRLVLLKFKRPSGVSVGGAGLTCVTSVFRFCAGAALK